MSLSTENCIKVRRRIACLEPAATQVCLSLGLASSIVGITHECKLETILEARQKEGDTERTTQDIHILTRNGLSEEASQAEIHKAVTEEGQRRMQEEANFDDDESPESRDSFPVSSLYPIVRSEWQKARPDLVFTQDLCAVCAPTPVDVKRVAATAHSSDSQTPTVVSLQPKSLEEVADTFVTVANHCFPESILSGSEHPGQKLKDSFWTDLKNLRKSVENHRDLSLPKPRFLMLEWLDPPFSGGHWVHAMMDYACVESAFPPAGRGASLKSPCISWTKIAASDPDGILVGCCGFSLQRNIQDTQAAAQNLWSLRAANQLFACDGNSYFAQPTPLLLHGTVILALVAYQHQPRVIKAIEECFQNFSTPLMPPDVYTGWKRVLLPQFNVPGVATTRIASSSSLHQKTTMPSSSSYNSNNKYVIICAGLNCLDLQLLGCTQSGQKEAIEQYERAVYCAGGSASMTSTTLAQIISSPETTSISILTKLGVDRNAEILLDFYTKANLDTRLVFQDSTVATALSVLPIFKTGGRGCFFNLASNNTFSKDELIRQLHLVQSGNNGDKDSDVKVKAFLFGYPHLMPLLQGDNLKAVLQSVRQQFGANIVIGVDLNGVSRDNHHDQVLGPALQHVDILHLNEEEAEILSGHAKQKLLDNDTELKIVCETLHTQGCAVVVLSIGQKGMFVSVTSNKNRLAQCPSNMCHWTPGTAVRCPAYQIVGVNGNPPEINANGAGDALFAGFCYAVATTENLTVAQTGAFAALVAQQRCNVARRDTPLHKAHDFLQMVHSGNLPPALPTILVKDWNTEDSGKNGFHDLHQRACEEGKTTYVDPATGYQVFTELAHRKRGKCCGSGCRHCPYSHMNVKDKLSYIQQPAFLYQAKATANDKNDSLLFSCHGNNTTQPVKVLFFSGGKDSFLTVRALARQHSQSPFGLVLLTTFDAESRLIAHQEVPIEDVLRQAQHLNISLLGVPLHRSSGQTYVDRIKYALNALKAFKVTSLIFGDLHLQHIKEWRESSLGPLGYTLEFPLWKTPYSDLMDDLEASGVPCIVTGTTCEIVPLGTVFDREFYNRLSTEAPKMKFTEKGGEILAVVDSFGERGEFHSLAQVWKVSREMALGIVS